MISPSFSPTDNQLEKLLTLNLKLAEKKLLVLGHQRSVKGDRWINAIVYELYRLIEEEVAIAEPFFYSSQPHPIPLWV